jgi:signal transduction histidine kinase
MQDMMLDRMTKGSWALPLGVAALLSVLAVLQYRWIGEISEAELQRARSSLQSAATRFAREFDRELTRAWLTFDPVPGGGETDLAQALQQCWERWTSAAPYPDLVRAVFVVQPSEAGDLELERLDPAAGQLVSSAWPEDLEPLRQRLDEDLPEPPPERERLLPSFHLADEVPALALPLFEPRHRRWMRSAPFSGPRHFVLIWLDREAICTHVLPALMQRHFATDEGEGPRIAIVRRQARSEVIYRAGPGSEVGIDRPAARADLFRLLPPDEARSLAREARLPPEEPTARQGEPAGDRAPPPQERFRRRGLAGEQASEGRWELLATHPSGSLDEAVARARYRNLGVSAGILLLLGLSVGLLVASSRRAEQLARQQLEFVVGVTHELLTPLAALRSAGQNLADGVVREPQQIRRYGMLVDGEGRRLAEMVGQVLELAGMQSGQRRRPLERVSVEALVRDALAESRPALEQAGFTVELELADGLPPILADPVSLGRAIQNLVGNAIKHASQGRWIGVRAHTAAGRAGPEVRLVVEDRGPGIDPADLPHLFEPFYRGRGVAGSRIEGAGLGLSLVRHIAEAHGGRVSVSTQAGRGSAFTVHLPAAPQESA